MTHDTRTSAKCTCLFHGVSSCLLRDCWGVGGPPVWSRCHAVWRLPSMGSPSLHVKVSGTGTVGGMGEERRPGRNHLGKWAQRATEDSLSNSLGGHKMRMKTPSAVSAQGKAGGAQLGMSNSLFCFSGSLPHYMHQHACILHPCLRLTLVGLSFLCQMGLLA